MGGRTIAFQGEHGAYSEEAIFKEFGKRVKTVPAATIREVFQLTEAGGVDAGVVPVENSVEGSINETYDMLLSSEVRVVGEVVLRVVHCLIALPTARLARVKVVYSHPQALAQCRDFVTSRGLEPIVTYDTAGSVKMIKEKRLEGAAAIAGQRAAEIYGLKVLKKGIEDYATNSTRFLVIKAGPGAAAEGAGARGGARKTSLIFSVKHTPGSLYNALEVFAREKINLTKIESRPTKERPWEYYFFVDFEGSEKEPRVARVLSELGEKTAFMKLLGSYPRSRADGR